MKISYSSLQLVAFEKSKKYVEAFLKYKELHFRFSKLSGYTLFIAYHCNYVKFHKLTSIRMQKSNFNSNMR